MASWPWCLTSLNPSSTAKSLIELHILFLQDSKGHWALTAPIGRQRQKIAGSGKDTNYWCWWWKVLLVHPWDLFGNDLFLQGFISKKDSFNFTLLLTRTVSEKKPLLKVWKKIHPGRLQSCDPPSVWKCPRGFCWDLGTRGCRTAWLGFTSSVKFLKEILKKKFSLSLLKSIKILV